MTPDPPVPRPEQVAAFFERRRTRLVALVFTDLVDSTALLSRLGDQGGANFLQQRRQLIRQVLAAYPEGEEIETAGDSFLLAFAKPSDAVRFALQVQGRLHGFSADSGLPVQERVGIHLGEVVIAEHETEAKAKDLYGIQLATCARVMALAVGGQILLTRGVFDSARQVLKGEDIPGVRPLSWVSHGPYLLKGIEEAVEVCEVGEAGARAFEPPKTSEKAQRAVRSDEETMGRKPRDADDRPSVVVLPFANLSADPEQEFFCDGVTEEIINALAQVRGLRVLARTSAFAFKGKGLDAREIGGRLDVGAIVEGSVRKAGDRLRITAQLIDVRDGSHLWSERFDRRLEDVFAIQDEIALAVAEKLEVELLARERAAVVKRHTENLEAHNAYLVGLFEWNKMSREGFVRCQELFQEAMELDPEFAPPYARLADSFTSVTWWSDQSPKAAIARAFPLLEKALALDPDLAHAHSVVGHVSSFFERDWAAGERSLRKAIELAPNDALAQTYLALLLMVSGRGTEASQRARLALRLDPLSPANNVWAGTVLVFSGEPEAGLSVIERQVAMTPHLWMPKYWLSVALATGGRCEEARAAGEKALELSGDSSLTQCNLAMICYRLGDRPAGDALFTRLQERAEAGYVAPMFLTWLHLARGESEAALSRAQEALAANDPWVSPHHLMSPAIVPADPCVDGLIAGVLP